MNPAPAHQLVARGFLREAALTAALLAGSSAAPARAHFVLVAPDSVKTQDMSGSPQKAPPCGEEAGGMLTNKVTAFKPGDTVSITIQETVFHPGHYRVALATDRADLPAEPAVTPEPGYQCGSAVITAQPVFPVLADGLLVHTKPLTGVQTMTVTLPSDFTCTKCTLQIIEFMSDHDRNTPGDCYYHHCADLSIQAPTTAVTDAGQGVASDAGSASTGASDASISPINSLDAGGGTAPPMPHVDAGKVDAGQTADTRKDADVTDTEGPQSSHESGCGIANTGERGPLDAVLVALGFLFTVRRRRRAPYARASAQPGRET